ncbi:MAG: HlyD family efflux transporter periplasmic adaptor subunit [Calditrichaeota bacterium]|nr:HlyD family efflux transporter periplasmic adaptor subunit [Calditrichota bacterium]
MLLLNHISVILVLFLLSGCGEKPLRNPSGTLEAVEVAVSSLLSGRVVEVRQDLGDRIARGDTLVVIDTELIALQKTQTAAGLSSIAAQKRVAGEALSQAERNLAFLTTQLQRVQALFEQGSAQQQQIDELTTKRDVAIAAVEQTKHQIEVFDAEVGRLNATLTVFDRQLKDGVITAPSAGVVIVRAVEPGEVVTPGKVVFKTADLTRLELRIFLTSNDLFKVKLGQNIEVIVDAFKNEIFNGTVNWISSAAEFTPKNAQTREARAQLVYAVKIALDNPDGRLAIGMPAEALF